MLWITTTWSLQLRAVCATTRPTNNHMTKQTFFPFFFQISQNSMSEPHRYLRRQVSYQIMKTWKAKIINCVARFDKDKQATECEWDAGGEWPRDGEVGKHPLAQVISRRKPWSISEANNSFQPSDNTICFRFVHRKSTITMVAVWTKVALLFSTKRGLIYSSFDTISKMM